jgi:hypothetical protein
VTVRIVPAGLAVVVVLIAFAAFVRPTAPRVAALRAQVQAEKYRLAAAGSEDAVLRAIGAQQRTLAVRVRGEERVDEGTAEAHVVADLTTAAAACNVSLISVSAKGTSSPLAPASAPGDGSGAVSSARAAGSVAPADVAGVRLPRSVVVEGALPGVLRFVDRLGHLRQPVRLLGFSLSQHARLQAAIDIEVLVIDRQTLLEAQG